MPGARQRGNERIVVGEALRWNISASAHGVETVPEHLGEGYHLHLIPHEVQPLFHGEWTYSIEDGWGAIDMPVAAPTPATTASMI